MSHDFVMYFGWFFIACMSFYSFANLRNAFKSGIIRGRSFRHFVHQNEEPGRFVGVVVVNILILLMTSFAAFILLPYQTFRSWFL